MIATRNILIASVLAPLVLVLPSLGVTGLVSYGFLFPTTSDTDRELFLFAGAFGALYLHLVFSAFYALTSLALRKLGFLSRRVLFLLGALASLLIASWFAQDWLTYLSGEEALANFAGQALVCLAIFTLLSTLWWRIAAGKQPSHSLRSSDSEA